MPAYISQSEAATYVDALSTWSASQAGAYLTAASAMVDQYTARTFASADLTPDVKMAVAFLADHLKNTSHSAGVVTSERIGDYAATYQPVGGTLPEVIEQLLSPYKVLVFG